MLVLTRKDGESVIIGSPDDGKGPITVKVLGIQAGRVKLGFQVADSVSIERWEVWEHGRFSGRPIHSPGGGTPANPGQMERWEDDGGDVASPKDPSIVHEVPSTKSEQK